MVRLSVSLAAILATGAIAQATTSQTTTSQTTATQTTTTQTTGTLTANPSSTVVTVMVPDADTTGMSGSVVEVNPTGTSFLIPCPTNTDEECTIPEGVSLLYGPSTMVFRYTDTNPSSTYNEACNIQPSSMVCATTIEANGTSNAATSTYSGTSTSSWFFSVTVTAGAEKLTATGSSSGTGSVTSTGAGGTGTQTGGASSSSSTGGVPRATQNAAVLGAAALLGGALLI